MPLKKGKIESVQKTGDLDVELLLEDLEHGAPEVRRKAAIRLADFPQAAPGVAARLGAEEDEIVLSALSVAVTSSPSEAGVQALLELIRGEDAAKRTIGVDALRQMPARLLEFVQRSVDDPDPDVRILVANTFQHAAVAGVAPLLADRLAREEEPNVLAALVDALLEIGTEVEAPALDELRARLGDEDFLAFAVEAALETIRARGDE